MTTEQRGSIQTRLERTWLKPLTSQISGWDAMGFVGRIVGREAKHFTLYRLNDRLQPEVLEHFAINNFTMSLLGAEMLLLSSKRALRIGHEPTRIGDYPVYLWLPAHLDARFMPFPCHEDTDPSKRQVNWRFCVRSNSNPEHQGHWKAGDVHFVESYDFRKSWPGLATAPATHN